MDVGRKGIEGEKERVREGEKESLREADVNGRLTSPVVKKIMAFCNNVVYFACVLFIRHLLPPTFFHV